MTLRASSAPAILCAVVDCAALGPDPYAWASSVFQAGVDWIQLRDRSVEGETLLRVARSLVAARDAMGAPRRVLVNKRVDVAWAAAADGVHLGVDALDATSVDTLQPEGRLMGRSFHSIAEIESSAREPLTYAHLAPIWDPRSKAATRPALGLEILARACLAGLPILAQGGIDPERAASAIRAGAAGVAVTGILDRGDDPIDQARRLRRALDGAHEADRPSVSRSSVRNRGANR